MTRKLPKTSMESLRDEQVYATYDLGASSALITAGFYLVSVDKTNLRKAQFIFRKETGIEKVIEDFWADRLDVRGRTFFDNVRHLKNRLYSD